MNDRKKTGPPDGPDQIYKVDRWTSYQWRKFVDGDPSAQGIVERGREKQFSFPRFSREVFGRLFADDSEAVGQIRPEDQWAETAHRELTDLPEFERLRRRCRADRINAGAAATAFLEHIVEKMSVSDAEDPEPLRDQIRGLNQFAKNLKANGDDASEVDREIEALKARGQEAVRKALAYAGGIDPSELRRGLRAACEAADRAVDRVEAQLGAFCGWGNGNGIQSDVAIDAKAELARQVSRSGKLQALAREAGRLRRIAATKQRSKSDRARDEVVDIGLGADLGRLLPSELVKLGDSVLSGDFARRFFERGLLQYELGGKETQGRGPIVICLDQSSSMEGAKEIWSKAMALALLQIATMQKRRCRVVHFNGQVKRVDDWTSNNIDPRELLASMEPFFGGGTAFEPPLRSALEAVERDRKWKKADVILVTDGECDVSETFRAEWSAARKRLELTCYAVHVDAAGGVAPATLKCLADNVLALADVGNDAAVTEALLDL